ncbi:MAG: MerR family DNA-binding transcriptional regulator [Propionibacteriaceae bacterium]
MSVTETTVGSARLTVSALARRVGVAADTIRYYEKAGLLPSPPLPTNPHPPVKFVKINMAREHQQSRRD